VAALDSRYSRRANALKLFCRRGRPGCAAIQGCTVTSTARPRAGVFARLLRVARTFGRISIRLPSACACVTHCHEGEQRTGRNSARRCGPGKGSAKKIGSSASRADSTGAAAQRGRRGQQSRKVARTCHERGKNGSRDTSQKHAAKMQRKNRQCARKSGEGNTNHGRECASATVRPRGEKAGQARAYRAIRRCPAIE